MTVTLKWLLPESEVYVRIASIEPNCDLNIDSRIFGSVRKVEPKHTRSLGLTAKAVVVSVVLAFAPGPSAQRPTAPKNANWPLHNLDLAGSRFSTLDLINTSNVKSLTPRWLFQTGVIDGVSNQT